MKNTEERPTRSILHMITAKLWSQRSLCIRAQVGCLITSYDDKQIFSFGYNGPAHYVDHQNCKGTPSLCECLHAEENAIIRLHRSWGDSLNMYTTVFPCYMCAQRIVQVGEIHRLFYSDGYRDEEESRKLLHDADIDIVPLKVSGFRFSYEGYISEERN